MSLKYGLFGNNGTHVPEKLIPFTLPIEVIGDGTATVVVIPLASQPIALDLDSAKLPTGVFTEEINLAGKTITTSLDAATQKLTVTFNSALSSGARATFWLTLTYDGV